MGLFTKIIDLQKLGKAWERVKANRPAAGADGISVEEFEAGKRENLIQLHLELVENRYIPQPVRMISIQKNGKDRSIGLISMRDKVVQQSIQLELSKKYEPFLSEHCYAYRNGRSALTAVETLDRMIRESDGKELWIYKGDITDFFENIVLEKLLLYMERDLREKELIELLKNCLFGNYFTAEGEIRKKEKGVFQGSSLSPVLSNIYMINFDRKMEKQKVHYFRYSDDFLFLGESREQLQIIKRNAEEALTEQGMKTKEEKTLLCPLKTGVNFLGYRFDEKGKEIPVKAGKELAEKLEEVWLAPENRRLSIEEKMAQGCQIMNGWAQYYPDVWRKRVPENIYEYVVSIYLAVRRQQEELIEKLREQRKNYKNIHKDITVYFCTIWERFGEIGDILFEYEQYFQVEDIDIEKIKPIEQENKNIFKELLKAYHLFMVNETENYYSDIIQIYTDLGCYNKAEKILEQQKKRETWSFSEDFENEYEVSSCDESGNKKKIRLEEEQTELYMELFVAREDIFAQASVRENGKQYYEMVEKPLLAQEISLHLAGEKTIASYIRRSNNTVKYMVFDIDLSKKILLKYPKETKEFQEYIVKAKKLAAQIIKRLKKTGIHAWLEYSGFRGYHVWIFFKEWISCRYVWQLQQIVSEEELWTDNDITVELFPNKAKVREGQAGQAIKLPLGRHVRSGETSLFLDEYGQRLENQAEILKMLYENRVSLETVKKVLARGIENEKENRILPGMGKETAEEDIRALGRQPERIQLVLKKCQFMRYLCMKAKNTGYLTHGERLSILYVFGHIGEQGKEFVHTIMEFTLNYQYAVTEKFILKCPAKPVSCIKLREQYKMITAEIGCNCNFRGMKNCYPSPVLHVLKDYQDIPDDVTIPSVRNVTKEKEKEIYGQINIHNKMEEIALKLIEMKKQRRGVDRVIRKYEEELCSIFDNAGIDCVELEIGVLMRRKIENGYEWVIEL